MDEIFGFPPLLPLEIRWICVVNNEETGNIEFYSSEGLESIASNCRMKFFCTTCKSVNGKQECRVDFEMEFMPLNPLALISLPLLQADNNLAIKVFLQSSVLKTSLKLINYKLTLLTILMKQFNLFESLQQFFLPCLLCELHVDLIFLRLHTVLYYPLNAHENQNP